LDKHIRKFRSNGVIDQLLTAGETMDPNALFEAAHALKGVSGKSWIDTSFGCGFGDY
jgi:hypothetical protein